MFVKADGVYKERRLLKDQFSRCMFYEMTMEQNWEQIYSRSRDGTHHPDADPGSKPAEVAVTATVRRSTSLLGGTSVVQEGGPEEDVGAVWFRPAAGAAGDRHRGAGNGTVGKDEVGAGEGRLGGARKWQWRRGEDREGGEA